jgi:RimJ/RimL family protein N-acetyltransferase
MYVKVRTCSHPFPITREQEEHWYAEMLSGFGKNKIFFIISENESRDAIGYIFLNDIDWVNRHCYWGGALANEGLTGRGLGKEAVQLIISYAIHNLNMNKVYALVLADNPALNTWLRSGAKQEGLLKSHIFQDGQYKDSYLLAWYKESLIHN